MCKGLNNWVKARTVTEGGQLRWFGIERGLRQECPLLPTLFNLYVSGMVDEFKGARMGVKIDDLVWCTTLLYAIDSALTDTGVMQDSVVKWMMKFNRKKSKVMVVGKGGNGLKWNIDEEKLKISDGFRYLGVKVDRKLRGNVHLEEFKEKAEEWIGKIV